MKQFIRHSVIPAVAITLTLCGYAGLAYAQEKSVPAEVNVAGKHTQQVYIPQTFGSSQIKGWYAPDNKTLIIETSRGDFKGTFANNCSGILFTEDIGFRSTGGTELDKFTTIILPDGQICFFKELVAYTQDEQDRDKNRTAE